MNLDPGRATSNLRDCRLFLESAYRKRWEANPHYSLGAYARSLHTSHSALSQILRGTRSLTPKTAMKLGIYLGIPEMDLQAIFANDMGERRKQVARRNFHRKVLRLENIQLLVHWYAPDKFPAAFFMDI